MNKLNFLNKQNGDSLEASEWNSVVSKVDELVDSINEGGNSGGGNTVIEGDSHVVYNENGKHNLTIQTLPGTNGDLYLKNGELKGGKINIESASDLLIKPGDDITLYSHHREAGNQREITLKVMNGSELSVDNTTELNDYPVDLLINTANITLTTKDKATYISEVNKIRASEGKDNTNDSANILNIEVNRAKGQKGYLKVRAQAIDLRCEEHGGIALQPKGEDGQGHINKIKFEHGGGDGLEFGTFNTEKTSIFTDEYRFNRKGVWKMATRSKITSDKIDLNDPTTNYKYQKQADDFYDIIDQNDEQCTTKDIIKTAFAMNGAKSRHTKITNKGALEIVTNETYQVVLAEDNGSAININTISPEIAALTLVGGEIFNDGDFTAVPTNNTTVYTNGTQFFTFNIIPAGDIKIDSGAGLKLGGILDFGSSFNFGETDNGIEVQYKLTKKNATKDCGVLKVVGVNNHTSNNLTVDGVTVAPGETETIAQCSILDIIKLTNYMKTNNQGPWTPPA